MNYKKIILLLCTLVCVLVSGVMISNVQSRQADDLLEAHGMSNNTRYITIDSNKKVASFLKYIDENYKNVQIHFEDRYTQGKVLVWANQTVTPLPTYVGRYFSKDDFKGRVSVAVVEYGSSLNTEEVQNNKYLINGQTYYSVIGQLKRNKSVPSNMFFLSTGINQPTAQTALSNYRIVLDAAPKTIAKISKHYHAEVKTPVFVKRHHQHYLIYIIPEIIVALLMIIILASLAWIAAKLLVAQAKISGLKGRLLTNWIINRALRLILIVGLIMIISLVFLNTHAFYSNRTMLSWIVGLEFCLQFVTFLVTCRKGYQQLLK